MSPIFLIDLRYSSTGHVIGDGKEGVPNVGPQDRNTLRNLGPEENWSSTHMRDLLR